MRKFKLIKEYPGSPEIGTIAKSDINKSIYSIFSKKEFNFGDDYIKSDIIEKNPEFWQEIIEKKYEILSFLNINGNIIDLHKNGKYCCKNSIDYNGIGTIDIDYFLEQKEKYSIFSIKRLSDGEIFTVGHQIIFNHNGINNDDYRYVIKLLDIHGGFCYVKFFTQPHFFKIEHIHNIKKTETQTKSNTSSIISDIKQKMSEIDVLINNLES